MIELKNIFTIYNGNGLDKNKMSSGSVNFVSRTRFNNGVSAQVLEIDDVKLYDKGLITVALGGSVLSSFVQTDDFYTGQNIAVLEPKYKLSLNAKLYYCSAIKANAYRFTACGREANRFLSSLLIPDLSDLPDWINNTDIDQLENANQPLSKKTTESLHVESWKPFEYQELFEVKKGKRLTKADMTTGKVPFIGSIDSNNGYRQYIGQEPIYEGNTITVNYNGSVAEAFYQPQSFWASDDVNVLCPKFQLNQFVALFIVTLIKLEKYRFNYGRKWTLEKMKQSIIKLPAKTDGTPDFEYMENYIKSLSYSSQI